MVGGEIGVAPAIEFDARAHGSGGADRVTLGPRLELAERVAEWCWRVAASLEKAK